MKLSFIATSLLALIALAPAITFAQNDEIDMDDVKISLVTKGALTAKKINGPDKGLLQLKISQQLLSSQKLPESLQPESLDILELNIGIIESSTLPVLNPNQDPMPVDFSTTPDQLPEPIDFPTDQDLVPALDPFPIDPDELP